ncbi:MAG TPA: YncE family protein [Rhabdochlamydiaceae bacterium]|nr:YncE family protein [Rhabdochlamydiaceae bacterium]
MKLFFILLLMLSPHVFAMETDLNPPGRHIAVLIRPDYRGEVSFAHRIKSACKNLGWRADIVDINRPRRLRKKNLDFVINLVPGIYKRPKCKNYMAIFDPLHHYFRDDGFLKREYRNYDGYLLTYSPWFDDKNFNGDKLPYIKWYPTAHRQEYKKVDFAHLFYLCCAWGNRFEDKKFQQFLRLLDKEHFMRFYGSQWFQKYYPQSYQSFIPYDENTLCETASRAGVTLVLHSCDHNAYGLPSGRIFEAAAASTMIVCDENAFVKEHFGDSVLYIDTDESAESIHKQVNDHMHWIQSNQEAALEKAKSAHQIYKKHFLLEDQLLRLGAFHDQLPKKNVFSRWLKKVSALFCSGGSATASLIHPIPLTVLPNVDHQYSLINSVDFHPQENLFCATYTHNNKISFYEIDSNHRPYFLQSFHNPEARLSEPQHAVFSPDGNKLAVANWTNQTLNVYHREGNGFFCEKPVSVISSPDILQQCKPHGIAFSPCGNFLAVAYGASNHYERAIALFQSKGSGLECVSVLKNTELSGTPKGITFSPDGSCLLVTLCEANSIVIFNIENQAISPVPKQTIQGLNTCISRPEDVKLSPDGSYCAVSNSDRDTVTFYPFDQKSNSILQSDPCYVLQNSDAQFHFPHGMAFSSDGSYLLVTQFGHIHTTEEGDISWDSEMLSSEAKVNLYLMSSESL